MFENPRRGRQARNFGKNVPKILDLKSSSNRYFPKIDVGCPWLVYHDCHNHFAGSVSDVSYCHFNVKPFLMRFYLHFNINLHKEVPTKLVACVANVSNWVIARHSFFCSLPNFLDELARKRLLRRLSSWMHGKVWNTSFRRKHLNNFSVS